MSRHQELRAVMVVERAHPRRIARNADEWMRCAAVLEEAAARIDFIAAQQSHIGGRTGPSMAIAMARASDALRVKARDLQRGSDALAQLAEATFAHQEERRTIDRDHPDDGNHVEWREARSGRVADSQEAALRHGVAVMKSIEVGDDPNRSAIVVTSPPPVTPPTTTWWPRPPVEEPPLDPDVDPDAGYDDPDGPGSQDPGGDPVALSGSGAGGTSSLTTGALAGAGILGGAGLLAGGRALAGGGAVPAAPGAPVSGGARGAVGGAGGLGGRGPAGAGGVLGRGGASGGAGGAAGGRGGATGGVGGGARGRRRDDERGEDRDLYDDGEGWLDDDAGPGVLR